MGCAERKVGEGLVLGPGRSHAEAVEPQASTANLGSRQVCKARGQSTPSCITLPFGVKPTGQVRDPSLLEEKPSNAPGGFLSNGQDAPAAQDRAPLAFCVRAYVGEANGRAATAQLT